MFRKSLRARLWIGGLAVALFVTTLLAGNALLARGDAPLLNRIGHDFLPFYAAGTLLREGRPNDIYNVAVLRSREQQIASENNLSLGDGFGPFWNPPFFAIAFAPLSALPFRAALLIWLGINLAALAAAVALLCGLVAKTHPHAGWRAWGVVPLLVLVSTPFLLALTHGQNTFCSLLLLTLAVLAWRSRRALLAGLALGLLAYKPQLAAVVGLILFIDLGWKFAAGAAMTVGSLLLTCAMAMPGVLETYRTAMPQMLHFMQVEQPYLWERHVTLKAFWRLLVQGYATGEVNVLVFVLTFASAGALSVALITAAFRCRRGAAAVLEQRDRLIAATIASMPLVMPFYFDYDLLLLAIPAVLYAIGASHGRWTVAAWCTLYVWLIINPDIAELTRVNLAVPLLAALAASLVAQALQRRPEMAQLSRERAAADLPLKAAA